MQNLKAAIVVPTIREDNIRAFLSAWNQEFSQHTVIIVEDNPGPSFKISGQNVRHYSWADIDSELGKDAWIIPRRTDCVRSYGYYKASREDVDFIVTLDDDCYPCSPDFLQEHGRKLSSPAVSPAWVPTGIGVAPRGMPYFSDRREIPCAINHGLWTEIPDFDAMTQLVNGRLKQTFERCDQVIPVGSYFPMCGMNLAFRPQVVPAMYFLLMGQKDWPFDRFGDIWCGLISKKICDHLNLGVKSGAPAVQHLRASNVWTNLRKEQPGYEINETLWKEIDSIILTHDTVKDCYAELATKFPLKGPYWSRLTEAMQIWANLF